MDKKKLWTGRISKEPALSAEKFTSSIKIDKRLYIEDLIGNAAYVIGLENIGIISNKELKEILSGLVKIKEKIESGRINYENYEDIHSLIEFELRKIIGDPANKIHTGRSRNDQIIVDELIFLKSSIANTINLILELQKTIILKANENIELIFPAYTHMQKAQPVLVSHYLHSYYEKFLRSVNKLFLNFESCDFLPLGAGACVGSSYNINRNLLADLLKFSHVSSNSMDIVSNREFIIDYIYSCSIIMQNLSRFAEDLIIFNSQEFEYINIDDSFCTGSSIMTKKKNPDILELIRGKCAIVIGHLVQIFVLLKGLPLTYNSDLQEDKKILFNVINETTESIKIFTELLKNIEFNKEILNLSCKSGFIQATDAADYLVKKGLSFRQAHNIIGKIVLYCIDNNIDLDNIELKKLKQFSKLFDEDFYEYIDIKNCINSKATNCSTSVKSVKNNLSIAKSQLQKLQKDYESLLLKIPNFNEIIKMYLN